MARPLRLESPGNFYHITVRGDRKERIFEDDADRVSLLQLINEAVELHHWHLLAYCLMNNHYHLEVETPIANLAAGMRRINGAYTRYAKEQLSGSAVMVCTNSLRPVS